MLIYSGYPARYDRHFLQYLRVRPEKFKNQAMSTIMDTILDTDNGTHTTDSGESSIVIRRVHHDIAFKTTLALRTINRPK